MVAVVGAPAVDILAEVLGADVETVALVGDVHQHLGALARLGVFIGDGIIVMRMTDVVEMLIDALGDVDHADLSAELFGHDDRVGLGARRGAEARHRAGDHIRRGQTHALHGHRADHDGKSRVHAAGDADDTVVEMGKLHAPHKTGDLDVQHALAISGKRFFSRRKMRVLAVRAGEGGIGERVTPVNQAQIIARQIKAAVPAAKRIQMLHVDLADGKGVGILALGKKLAPLRNEAQAGIAVIRRALAPAGRGQHKTAGKTAGERAGIRLCLVPGRNRFGEGRHLSDHGRAFKSIGNSGGEDLVPVGAKLDRNAQITERVVTEERVGAENGLQFADSDEVALALVLGKERSLDVLARDKPEQLAVADHGSDAQQPCAVGIGQADKDEHVLALTGTDDLFKRTNGSV